jgi:hypothetical protein
MNADHTFQFGAFTSSVHIGPELPSLRLIAGDFSGEGFFKPLVVCDENTRPLAEAVAEKGQKGGPADNFAYCVL